MKNMKSYVRAALGMEDMEKFNDFEKGTIYMERSRLDSPLPSREEIEIALEFARETMKNAEESIMVPKVIKQVGNLSIELLEIQLETLDRCPEETDWTYRKSMEVTLENPDLCDRLDFTAGKVYQLMPLYTETMTSEYIKDFQQSL